MKKLFLGLFFVLIFLPSVSFGATQTTIVSPQLAAFIKQQDSDSVAFFQQQALDRGAFIKANPEIIATLDKEGKALMAQKYAQSHPGFSTANITQPPSLSADDQNTYSAFIQKQLNEKNAFLQQQAQAKQNFLIPRPAQVQQELK